jgi:peptide/nickel transport system permease protein
MRYFVRRLVHLAVVVFAVTTLTFLILNLLPGDVAYHTVGAEALQEDVEAVREELGLNRSIFARYADWLKNVASGDLGTSHRSREPVAQMLIARLPVTAELLLLSQIIALSLAVPLGILCASRAETAIDALVGSTAFAMISIPSFVMAIVLIYCFSLKLGWFPATGYVPLSEGFLPNIKSFILPSLSIGLVEWVTLMRVLRADMITTLGQDFILAAKAKGVPPGRILFKHALRPSSLTLITVLGINVGHFIGGALIVETIYALPGIARLLVASILARDFAMVQGCVVFITVGCVLINFLIDMLYSVIDPRIRRRRSVG